MNVLDRLSKALKGADKAGDTDAAKKLAGEIRRFLTMQRGRKDKVKELEKQALDAGLTKAHIDYLYETDKLIGAPKGAALAQVKQESSFNPKARSPTGALGLTQFTQVGVADVLYGRKPITPEERQRVVQEKQSLFGNIDKSLEFQRNLLLTIQRRSKAPWDAVIRNYNGDKKLESNGLEARENYITRIKGMLGE